MGYCIEFEECNIKISEENMKEALKVLSNKSFCWCDRFNYEEIDFDNINNNCEDVNEDNYDSISVYDAWEQLRYDIKYEDGYWNIVDFFGEKLGDEDEIFKLIAPYCEDGYIQFLGEDGDRFRYCIENKKYKFKVPTITWE